ncbi:MAG: cell filamentation protein Fic [Proteobacteria bacterium]|nr:cell filamentation protein Fic [Pseudomonadota bacterium]
MKQDGRYDTTGLEENEYEPGSNNSVLKNLCGITTVAGMEQAETLALLKATEEMFDSFDQDHCFSADDICSMHRAWLGGIYPWAGSYRQVMMSKGGFPFAAPAYIPKLMDNFEKDILARHTPCHGDDDTVALSLAIVHVELVLIHPFREGNGRLSRLLAILMGLQAGLPMLVFDEMEGARREAYFAAVRTGLGEDYKPMADIFKRIIEQSRSEG